MITIPLALSSGELVSDIRLLSFFPFIGVVLSFSGIIVLIHQRRVFYETLYAISTIRKALIKDLKELFKNPNVNLNDDELVTEEFKKIGIMHIDFSDFPTVKCYKKSNVIRWRPFSISIIFLFLYGVFIVINFILIYLFLTGTQRILKI